MIDLAGARRVVIGANETPVFLTGCGPRIAEADVGRFERKLGFSLPSTYRRFLLDYNGGDPVVGDVTGRDDDPSVGYQYGDAVSTFFGLGSKVPSYQRLVLPRDHPWDLPAYLLPIGNDAGGNAFMMDLRNGEIRFVDHERELEPLEQHRVMADDFLDLLRRVRTVEEEERIRAEETAANRAAIVSGPLPAAIEARCVELEERYPRIREGIRRACLVVFDEKGHFSVHEDPASRDVLDLVLWLGPRAEGYTSAELQRALLSIAWTRRPGGFGFTGYAPGFIDEWWNDRVRRGSIAVRDGRGTLTSDARDAIARKWFG